MDDTIIKKAIEDQHNLNFRKVIKVSAKNNETLIVCFFKNSHNLNFYLFSNGFPYVGHIAITYSDTKEKMFYDNQPEEMSDKHNAI